MVGIYSIINRKNQKRYIGQSVDVSIRIHTHFKSLARGDHPNSSMQKDYKKDFRYFNYEVLEYNVPLRLLGEREAYWAKFYNTFDKKFGYNHQTISKKRMYTKKIKKYTSKKKHIIVDKGV